MLLADDTTTIPVQSTHWDWLVLVWAEWLFYYPLNYSIPGHRVTVDTTWSRSLDLTCMRMFIPPLMLCPSIITHVATQGSNLMVHLFTNALNVHMLTTNMGGVQIALSVGGNVASVCLCICM